MKPALAIVDCRSQLDAGLMKRVEEVVTQTPLTVPSSENSLLVKSDWRDLLAQFMPSLFPNAWVYRGGHHIAVHASPPRYSVKPELNQPEAGVCLFRIVEAKA